MYPIWDGIRVGLVYPSGGVSDLESVSDVASVSDIECIRVGMVSVFESVSDVGVYPTGECIQLGECIRLGECMRVLVVFLYFWYARLFYILVCFVCVGLHARQPT